jgi:hypothetical protein
MIGRMKRTHLSLCLATVLVCGSATVTAVAASRSTVYKACANRHGVLSLLVKNRCHSGSKLVKLGARGAPGKRGRTGSAGPAGPFPTVLPTGKTLVGDWAINGVAGSGGDVYTAISFYYPLASALDHAHAPNATVGSGNADPTHCPGSVAHPSALPGYFCIYVALSTVSVTEISPITAMEDLGADPTGALLDLSGMAGTNESASGTWAVTAAR